MASTQLYFEGSWSILSTIGLVNVINGLTVISIIGVTPIALVPVLISVATAIANGLCYYAYYAHYGKRSTVAAAALADVFWLVQEAGLPFYSYMILRRLLKGRARWIFLSMFWTVITMMTALRLAIMACRIPYILEDKQQLFHVISQLHVGYFVLVAVVEVISTYFLLHIFAPAKEESRILGHYGLFDYLSRGTLVRVAALALIGTTRAITYSFQRGQSASSVSGELDRFVYALECMFPVVMYIDLLASRVAAAGQGYNSSRDQRQSRPTVDFHMRSVQKTDSRADKTLQTSDSQERIVDSLADSNTVEAGYNTTPRLRRESQTHGVDKNTIHKTVEFGVAVSTVP